MIVKNKGGILGGILAGALAGTAVGLMLAPKSGKESREVVGSKAGELQQRAGDYVDLLRAKFKKDDKAQAVGVEYSNHSDNHWTDGG